jgi:hypothetical protein
MLSRNTKLPQVPFKPNLVGQFDTTFFDSFEDEEDSAGTAAFQRKGTLLKRNGSIYQVHLVVFP